MLGKTGHFSKCNAFSDIGLLQTTLPLTGQVFQILEYIG